MDIVERLKQEFSGNALKDIADQTRAYVKERHEAADEIERLREALQHIRSLATTPVRQIRLRSILEQCVWFVNAALKEGE